MFARATTVRSSPKEGSKPCRVATMTTSSPSYQVGCGEHGQAHVLPQELGERVGVGPLVGFDVAPQQLALVLARLGGRRPVRSPLAPRWSRASPLPAAGRCSPLRRSPRAARRCPSPTTRARRAGSGPRAVSAAGAESPRRTRARSSPSRLPPHPARPRPGRSPPAAGRDTAVATEGRPGAGSAHPDRSPRRSGTTGPGAACREARRDRRWSRSGKARREANRGHGH